MSEQPKPLSAEVLALVEWIGNKTNLETHEGQAVYLHADDCPSFCDLACNGPEGAQAAERFDALLFATLDAESKRADALNELAEHSGRRADACEVLLEDWQECAGNLALSIKNQFHEESRTDEIREALAEFDRLASEATKGVAEGL